MTDPGTFAKGSPFKVTHNKSNFNLSNTTPELLKFQLQEQNRQNEELLRNGILETESDNDGYSLRLGDPFNRVLQKKLNLGNITLNAGSLPSLSSSPLSWDENDEFEIDKFVWQNSEKPNYLNLRILIENSIFDTNKIKKDSILSLATLKKLKTIRDEKENIRNYYASKISISQQFVSNIVANLENSDALDKNLLLKILKQNVSLQQDFLTVSDEIKDLNIKINNHNLACLVLGYVEDVKLSLKGSINEDDPYISSDSDSNQKLRESNKYSSKAFDNLISHIVSISAEYDITLPEPPAILESAGDRTAWSKSCIDAILTYFKLHRQEYTDTSLYNKSLTNLTIPSTGGSPKANKSQDDSFWNETSFFAQKSPNTNSDKIISEYRTALNDLRFSHQYLTKEYEYSKETSLKMLQEYRKKNLNLERELSALKDDSRPIEYDTLTFKDKEISKLRKEINLLRIDNLGSKHTNSSILSPTLLQSSSPTSSSNTTNISPITGEHLNILSDDIAALREEEYAGDGPSSMSIMSPTRPMSGNGGMSNAILRKEFKKIVSEIQDQYELKLSEERMMRRTLEEKLSSFNQN
ncbi:uncharacterized protein PRCAT00000828001 [Priceomyces carsonii]|uniref:uncharacterized protein n=1 Tax=Priceomyces carsonii TaxID=28549 RepID=UPI002ED8F50A|nr:unnamed protein product [Priceomyces carsonii]